jgi:hypothetical protein
VAVDRNHRGIGEKPLHLGHDTRASKHASKPNILQAPWRTSTIRAQRESHEVRRPRTWLCLFDSMILALAEYGTDAIAECSSPLLMFLL